MKSKYVWALLLALTGLAAYGAVALATPPSGISNPPWSPVIGRFASGIDATAKTDINPGNAPSSGRSGSKPRAPLGIPLGDEARPHVPSVQPH